MGLDPKQIAEGLANGILESYNPVIYIAGAVTGLPEDQVRETFIKQSYICHRSGWSPFDPVKFVAERQMQHDSWQRIMRVLIGQLMECDAILMLPCWTNSRGATLERYIAGSVGIPIYTPETLPKASRFDRK